MVRFYDEYIEYDDFNIKDVNNNNEYDEIKNTDSTSDPDSESDKNFVLPKYKKNNDFNDTDEYYHYLIKTLDDEKNKYLKFNFKYWEKYLVNDVLHP